MHNEKPPSDDFGEVFSSEFVVISLLVVVLVTFVFLFNCVEVAHSFM